MEFFKKWILNHLVETQAVLIIIIFIISVISGINSNSEAMIIALLVFIGTEFIVLSVGYLEQIINKLNSDKKSDVGIIINNNFEWIDFASQANHDLFISGPTLGSLYNFRRTLLKIPKHVKVRLLVHNFENAKTIESYCYVCSPKATPEKLREKHKVFQTLAEELIPLGNVEIRIANIPLHIAYIGCDIFESDGNSKIRAQHFLRKYIDKDASKNVDDKLIYAADQGTQLYDVYVRQLKALWSSSLPYITKS